MSAFMNNPDGTSKCREGEERYEVYRASDNRTRVQMDYRALNGKLFSVVAPTVERARACIQLAQRRAGAHPSDCVVQFISPCDSTGVAA